MPPCLAQPCPLPLYSLPAHTLELRLKWFAGLSCMMPPCLAQPCPLSLYSLPAHTVVYLSRVAGYGGIRAFSSLRFSVYDAAVFGTAVPALLPLSAGVRYYPLTAHAGV